ncbi:MAG: DUF6763 family protein [Chromatocurvus sp.]
MAMQRPLIGRWYRDLETGELFEVVARDDEAETAEVQYLDGEIAEYEAEVWAALALAPAAEPEDWRSAFELSDEDGIDPDLPFHPQDWGNPLNSIEPDTMWGVEDF